MAQLRFDFLVDYTTEDLTTSKKWAINLAYRNTIYLFPIVNGAGMTLSDKDLAIDLPGSHGLDSQAREGQSMGGHAIIDFEN